MKNEINILRKELFQQVKKIRISGVTSIALIGSFQYSKKLKAINDIDLIILVKRLTPQIYKKLILKFEEIAKTLTRDKIKVIVEKRHGPYKPIIEYGVKILQLHILIHTVGVWKRKGKNNPTYSLDANNFNINFVGKPLKKIVMINRLYKDQIKEHLYNRLKSLNKTQIYLLEYKVIKNKIKKVENYIKIRKKDSLEVLIFNVIIGWMNYLRYFDPNLKKDEGLMLKRAKKLLPKIHYNFISTIFSIKDETRNHKVPVKISLLKKKGLDFIQFLINTLD